MPISTNFESSVLISPKKKKKKKKKKEKKKKEKKNFPPLKKVWYNQLNGVFHVLQRKI